MSEQASYFRLGLFALGSALLLVLGIATIGARSVLRNTVRAETVLAESTSGLDVGAPVKHRGVKIGSVSRIGFAGHEYAVDGAQEAGLVVVEMRLDDGALTAGPLAPRLPSLVNEGLRARMATSGLVGPPFLELAFVDPGKNPPPPIPWKPRELYVPSTTSLVERVQTAVSSLAVKLGQTEIDTLVRDLDGLVKEARASLSEVEVRQISGEVRDLLRELREGVRSLEGVLGDAASAAASVRRLTEDGETALRPFLTDLPEASRHLRAVAERLDADMPAVARDVRRLVRRLDTLAATEQEDVAAILAGIRQLADDASRNPSRALFGEPPPRVDPGAKARGK